MRKVAAKYILHHSFSKLTTSLRCVRTLYVLLPPLSYALCTYAVRAAAPLVLCAVYVRCTCCCPPCPMRCVRTPYVHYKPSFVSSTRKPILAFSGRKWYQSKGQSFPKLKIADDTFEFARGMTNKRVCNTHARTHTHTPLRTAVLCRLAVSA